MNKDNTNGEDVEITFRSTELQPPLFLAGSFSNPPWTPLEMKHHQTNSGEHIFTKTIHAKPGTTVQYKFRVGPGNWWVLDETFPTATDDMGNRNNVLEISDKTSHAVERPPTPPPDSHLVPQAALKTREQSSHSGTNTPDFVQTTLEVAETASQIDPRTPEPEVSDEEAGRTGYRRLSSTPIAVVAETAAEVAGVAQALDFDEIDDIAVDIGPDFSHELAGEEDNGQDEAPVFAYEFAGGGFDRAQSLSGSEYSPGTYPFAGLDDGGSGSVFGEEFDLKDPTLERFPSNREGILERVRTIETGLTEDIPSFDGFPASPIVSAGRKSSADLNSESFSISPTMPAASSANWPQNGGNGFRPEGHSRSTSSVIGEPSPSLQSIMEETPLDDDDGDEAEGAPISMPAIHKKGAIPDLHATTTITPQPGPVQHTSTLDEAPIIVIHNADNAGTTESTGANASDDASGQPASLEDHTTTKTTAVAFPGSSQEGNESELPVSQELQQNDGSGQQVPPSTTPAPLSQPAGIDTVQSPNWLRAFVRLVFVDWIGGVFGKVFGRRRSG